MSKKLPVCSREHLTPDVSFEPRTEPYPNAKLVLVTGGAGYIGSHTVVELLSAGWEVCIVDNFCNSVDESVRRAEELAGKKICTLFEADIRKKRSLAQVFDVVSQARADPSLPPFAAIIHFAGLKSVSESVSTPLAYYDTNVSGTRHLLATMDAHGVRNLVFSSSATVYGAVESVPEGGLKEDQPTGATNAYGRSKLFVEEMLRDLCHSEAGKWNIVALRYFNPVGAHISGRIGEDPRGIPNNLMPFVTQVAVGKREALRVFGSDYSTHDGTGVRDFIHVVDLAQGHLAAIDYINRQVAAEKEWRAAHPDDAAGEAAPEASETADRSFFASGELAVFNLGTGTGYSVLELVACMERVSGKPIPYVLTDRRPGDVGEVFSNPVHANSELRWEAKLDLERMCADAWRWQSAHPNGYEVDVDATPPSARAPRKARLGGPAGTSRTSSRGFFISGGVVPELAPRDVLNSRGSSRGSGFLETPACAGTSENDGAIAEHLASAKAEAAKRRAARQAAGDA